MYTLSPPQKKNIKERKNVCTSMVNFFLRTSVSSTLSLASFSYFFFHSALSPFHFSI